MKKLSQAQSFVLDRRTDYIKTFNTPHGEKVLADLAKFCRATESTFNADARLHALAEGRREVWLRLRAHLDLPDEELFRYFGAPAAPIQQE